MRVLLVHGGACERELRQTRLTLEAQECQVDILDADPGANERSRQRSITPFVDNCDVVVFLIDPGLSPIDVQIATLAAKSKGKKLVGIQLAGAGIASVFEKFGSSLIPFVLEKIVAAVCGDYVEWINEKGEPRSTPDTERHVCKKRKTDAAA
jgi:hypothetical protein